MRYSNKRVGAILKDKRKQAGYKSARAFAEHMGYNVYTYTGWEQGRHGFTLEQAFDMALELGCTVDELCGRPPDLAGAVTIPNVIIRAYEESNEAGRFMLENQAKMILNTPEFSQGGAQPRVREGKAI